MKLRRVFVGLCTVFLVTSGCEKSEPTTSPTPTTEPTSVETMAPVTAGSPTPEPAASLPTIRYRLSFPEAHTHYASVEASVPTGGAGTIDLMMPVWTPGSYLVREYARHIESISARGADGQKLDIVKYAKNRWRIETGGRDEVTVRYRIYSRLMTVRSNWVERDFAVINGAPTFITMADDEHPRPHELQIVLPPGWSDAVTGLPPHSSGVKNHYRAPNFDILVDSPIVAGNPVIRKWTVEGVPHYLVDLGGDGVWDHDKAAADLEKLTREQIEFWREIPYQRYYFLNVISESGGGLEHLNSTLIMTSRWASRSRKSHNDWLRLSSHEFFHTWNVKRMRPKGLGPFDYERETHTRSLWIAEGLTSYYDNLLLHRSGITTRKEALERLSSRISGAMTRPGRKVQPLEHASFDAWVKYYRGDENSNNVTVSYYTKGSVVGFLLDAKIRKATDGTRSLDDVMRLVYSRHSGAEGYTPEEFRSAASEVAGIDLNPWFVRVLETTEELDFSEALAWYGLKLEDPDAPAEHEPGEPPDDPAAGYLGVDTANREGRLIVTKVIRGEPAFEAGINVDDEILAIGGFRVKADDLDGRLKRLPAGNTVDVLVSRRERILELPVLLIEKPAKPWKLVVDENATDAQKAHLNDWLTGRAPDS